MRRRLFLAGGAGAVAALSAQSLGACSSPGSHSVATDASPSDISQLHAEVAKLREKYVATFDAEYVDNVIVPNFLSRITDGERPTLPMIDLPLTKENALPRDLWGLLSQTWGPDPEHGVTVFLQGLEKRGPDNRRKRIYMSATTPDLYFSKYRNKVVDYFTGLFGPQNANKPLMRIYLDTFWDLYWDLHLGVRGKQIPDKVRQIGASFNAVLAYRDPTQKVVYDNYMVVRANLEYLRSWIDEGLANIVSGKTSDPEKTFAWYWLKNGEGSEYFNHQDVIFEVFHNFVAFSQWGNTLYNIMATMRRDGGNAQARDWFIRTMSADPDNAKGASFPPLERFVMELFRTISPNPGSISALTEASPPPFTRHNYMNSPHTSTSHDRVQWVNPDDFDPSRYEHAPTSAQIDEARIRQMGLAQCPFTPASFEVRDGRRATIDNSAFGTVFGVVEDKPLPVCDYAGFAPFGFGYRRCPGEQLTLLAFADVLRKVWSDKLEFVAVGGPDSAKMPIGPSTVITDDIGFVRP
ncbi:hypothetical protein [Mycobacterium sp. 141]|uniref:hypothetical protein n=1 Tax=Mycobacterium sp. 141 TaxID=1120797 RepID=UPI0003A2D27E|nr:hypothetical protein [Mycobacterium sp. 141]